MAALKIPPKAETPLPDPRDVHHEELSEAERRAKRRAQLHRVVLDAMEAYYLDLVNDDTADLRKRLRTLPRIGDLILEWSAEKPGEKGVADFDEGADDDVIEGNAGYGEARMGRVRRAMMAYPPPLAGAMNNDYGTLMRHAIGAFQGGKPGDDARELNVLFETLRDARKEQAEAYARVSFSGAGEHQARLERADRWVVSIEKKIDRLSAALNDEPPSDTIPPEPTGNPPDNGEPL